MNNLANNNQVTITGTIASEFEFSHKVFGESFYYGLITVKRLSNSEDVIPILVSEHLFESFENYIGETVKITGQFRSYNKTEEGRTRLILVVFVKSVESFGEQISEFENLFSFSGYVCKNPIYRKTPLGKDITDLLIAVNRPYGKTDYIPCICWRKIACIASELKVGDRIEANGRIQSRKYTKKINETHIEENIAYEVSIFNLRKVEH